MRHTRIHPYFKGSALIGILAFILGGVFLGTAYMDASAEDTTRISHIPEAAPKNRVDSLPEKSLALHNLHTGEEATITFWRDGAYLKEGLAKLNHFLRDHRTGDVTEMDPELFMLVHDLHRQASFDGRIDIVSGYRSKKTNEKLRAMGRQVAKRSQHIQGKAMDIRFPGYPVKKLRNLALKEGRGGVGYYPKSRFIHVDTGRVRQW